MDSTLIIKVLLSNLFYKREKNKRYYGKLFFFCRRVLRIVNFNNKYKVIGELPAKPVIFVGHHQNLKGVIHTILWLNVNIRVWALSVFCNKEECYNQYANYTFTVRYGWNKALAYSAAYVLSNFIPRLVNSTRVIPVYRKSIKGLNKTFDESVEALCNNENLLIFPDVDYSSDSGSMGEMYMGFISLDKYYCLKTGRHVNFVPIRANTPEKQISFGRPSSFKDNEKYAQGKKRISEELRHELNEFSGG